MVKFISYDGDYPNLCRGILVLSINGKEHSFGYKQEFPCFWSSGGCVSFTEDWDANVIKGSWEISVLKETKKFFVETFGEIFLEEAIEVMNDNVECGCCGGCV